MKKTLFINTLMAGIALSACAGTQAASMHDTDDHDETRVVVFSSDDFDWEWSDGDVSFGRGTDWDDLDTDNDGRLSRDEALEELGEKSFEQFDMNADGYIERREIREYAEAEVEKAMASVRIEMADLDERMKEMRVEMFGNERELAREARRIAREAGRAAREASRVVIDLNDAMFEDGNHFFMGPDGHMMIEDMDSDGDGNVSQEEFMKAREELFNKLDENGDGVLSEDELEANFASVWQMDLPNGFAWNIEIDTGDVHEEDEE